MRHIRIKIKTILISILAIGLLITFGDNLFWQGVESFNNIVEERFEINVNNIATKTIKNENKRLTLLLSENDYNLYDLVTYSGGGTSSSSHIRSVDSQKVFDQYLNFAKEYNLQNKYADYALNVALVQWFSGEMENTIAILDAFNPNDLQDEVKDYYYLLRMGIALTYNELEAVQEALGNIEGSEYKDLKENTKEFIARYFGVDLPYEQVEVEYDEIENNRYLGYFSSIFDILSRHKMNVSENYIEEVASDNAEDMAVRELFAMGEQLSKSVSGKVTANGEGLQGIFLYEDVDKNGMSSYEGFGMGVYVTDEKGEYFIPNIHENTESIGLIIPWHLIHDQQWSSANDINQKNFKNEVVNFELNDGVAFSQLEIIDDLLRYEISDPMNTKDRYYTMKIRYVDPEYDINGTTIDIRLEHDQMQGEIALRELIKESSFPFSQSSSYDELDIKRFLEPLYLSGEYYFELNPHTDNRESYTWNGIFTDALSTPLLVSGNEKMSDGDQLLADGEIERAMEWYQKDLSEHSLKVLVALYDRGYKPLDEQSASWEMEGADSNKAALYMEKLIDNYGETDRRLGQLANFYRESYDFVKEEETLKKLYDSNPSVYVSFDRAKNLIHQGHFDEGIQMFFDSGNPEIDQDRYYAYFLLGLENDKLTNEYKMLLSRIEGLEDYEIFNGLIHSGEYLKAWDELQQMTESDLKTFFTLLMLDGIKLDELNYEKYANDNQIDDQKYLNRYYVEKTNEMSESSIKQLLKMLKKDMNWFH